MLSHGARFRRAVGRRIARAAVLGHPSACFRPRIALQLLHEPCYTCYMSDMNIRNIEPIMLHSWKSAAAAAGLSLREWVITRLNDGGHAVAQVAPAVSAPAVSPVLDAVAPMVEPSVPAVSRGKVSTVPRTVPEPTPAPPANKPNRCRHGLTFCLQCRS